MITKEDKGRLASPWLPPLFLLGVALVAWLLSGGEPAEPGSIQPEPAQPGVEATSGAKPPRIGPAVVTDSTLPLLRIRLRPEDMAALTAQVERSKASGGIEKRTSAEPRARVQMVDGDVIGEELIARIRLKGDLLDHIDTDKWSLRIELEDGLQLGMSSYSIQHPKTRSYLCEWLALEIARRDGLLAPRVGFVEVELNGEAKGVYFLEEHFTKQLLESQGRRDGPILRFDEAPMWAVWLKQDYDPSTGLPGPLEPVQRVDLTQVLGYDEKRFAKVEAMNERLQRARLQMRELQRQMVEDYSLQWTRQVDAPLRSYEATARLRGQTVEDLVDTRQMGRKLALSSFFMTRHGLEWHQLRFYHDPVADRLEPFVRDFYPRMLAQIDNYWALTDPRCKDFSSSDAVYEEAFRYLGRMAEPAWLQGVFAEFGPDLRRFAAVMRDEGILPEGEDYDAVTLWCERRAEKVAGVIRPAIPAVFTGELLTVAGEDGEAIEVIEVEAWCSTNVPVELQGFRFSNGRFVPAAVTLGDDQQDRRRENGAAALPRAGTRMILRFPADARLAELRQVQAIKKAIRAGETERDESAKLKIDVVYRALSEPEPRSEPLRLRRQAESVRAGRPSGRPRMPSLLEAIDRHPFLGYLVEHDGLAILPGDHLVEGDLLIPKGFRLRAMAGTRLRFAEGAVMVSESPLQWEGAPENPIVLEPQQGASSWGGLVVLDTSERSLLKHVVVRRAAEIQRGGWQTTGGVTFYHAPLDLIDCRFEDAKGEDALNVFGADLMFERVTFESGVSDLFDGDFVTGSVSDCRFVGSAGDALDVSGSRLQVRDCQFVAIGDKAISAGEDSRLEVRGGRVEQAAIAVASKDLSEVDIEGLRIDSAELWFLAAYVKKPEYGPARIVARNLQLGSAGHAPFLAQTDCQVEVDGRQTATEDLDVDELYRRKVLGK